MPWGILVPELEIEPLPATWEAQSLTTGLPEKSFHFHIFYTYNRSVTICRMVRFVVCFVFCFQKIYVRMIIKRSWMQKADTNLKALVTVWVPDEE